MQQLPSAVATFLRLLERFGAAESQAAVLEALKRGAPHPNSVRLALERRREERHEEPPVSVLLPEHIVARDVPVTNHRLDIHDQLTKEESDDEQP